MAVLTALAIGSAIASTALQARGAYKAGSEQKRVADYNAQQARLQATDAARRGVEDVNAMRRQVRGLEGSQRAGYAAQGVDVGTGTPGALQASTEGLLQSDLDRLRRNAEREALGYTSEAANYTQQGKYAKSAANWQMASTILGGATETALMAQRLWPSTPGENPAGGTSTAKPKRTTSPSPIDPRFRGRP